MRFTIFTPTHDPKFLPRLERSLQAQTFKDFEWLVVPNNGVNPEDIEIKARIVPYQGATYHIGEIKRFCCRNALGEILVEVDHDDELPYDCLEELDKAFAPNIDFCYSNCIEILQNQSFCYDQIYGWETRPYTFKGQQFLETISFPPQPATYTSILWSPNHVRAWRKSFYDRIGGHNPELAAADDFELVVRTYIGGNIKFLDKCLYVYHRHSNNSYATGYLNNYIQTKTQDIYDNFIVQVVNKWCNASNLRKIDLCNGIYSPDGYENINVRACDLSHLPFPDESVGVFRGYDALQHLKNPTQIMREIYRCLAPNGWFFSETPSTDGRGAFQDPTHVSFWNANSFWYYTDYNFNQCIDCPVKFKSMRIKDYFPSEFHKINNIPYVRADLCKAVGRIPGGGMKI